MIKPQTISKIKAPQKPKIAPAIRGGSLPGAGRKEGIKIDSGDYAIYTKARAKEKIHHAKLAEYEEKKVSGALIEVDLVRAEWQQILANVRAKLLSLPTKLAAQAMSAGTLAEMEALLTEGVHEALQELVADA